MLVDEQTDMNTGVNDSASRVPEAAGCGLGRHNVAASAASELFWENH